MKKAFLLTLFTLLFLLHVRSQDLRVGAAVRVITPDPLLPVSGGIGTPKKTVEKKGELFARAVVLEKGSTRIAIVSVDNLGWPSVLGDRSRELVKRIPAGNILIGATHTHSAPDAYGFPDKNGRSYADLKYLDWCVLQIAEAVNEALDRAQSATLKIAVGEAKGRIAYNYYAPELYDPRCGVIQAIADAGKDKGKVIATLVNYAVHPEVLGSSAAILSPDLCGPLYERIEAATGGVAIFMNGAQGGMVTADVRRQNGKEENTWEECLRIGTLLADEALRIVGDSETQTDPILLCKSKRIVFPVESEAMRYILRNSPLKMPSINGDSVSTRINFLEIGTARILTIPGEALPNIGYYLKRNLGTEHAFLFGLTNDAFGYMLSKVDFNSFRRYDYVSRTSLGEMTGEIYIQEVFDWLKAMEKLPAK